MHLGNIHTLHPKLAPNSLEEQKKYDPREDILLKVEELICISETGFRNKAEAFLSVEENRRLPFHKKMIKLGNIAYLEEQPFIAAYLYKSALFTILTSTKTEDTRKIKLASKLIEKVFELSLVSPGASQLLIELLRQLQNNSVTDQLSFHIAYFSNLASVLYQAFEILGKLKSENDKDVVVSYISELLLFGNTEKYEFLNVEEYTKLIEVAAVYIKDRDAGINMLGELLSEDKKYLKFDWLVFVDEALGSDFDEGILHIVWTVIECARELYITSPTFDLLSKYLEKNIMLLNRLKLKEQLKGLNAKLEKHRDYDTLEQRAQLNAELERHDVYYEEKRIEMLELLLLYSSSFSRETNQGILQIIRSWYLNKKLSLPKEFFENEFKLYEHEDQIRKLDAILIDTNQDRLEKQGNIECVPLAEKTSLTESQKDQQ